MTSNNREQNNTLPDVKALSMSAGEKEDKEKVPATTINQNGDTTSKEKDSESEKPHKATEQSIDPWSVEAATDEQGNTLEFDYVQISKYVKAEERDGLSLHTLHIVEKFEQKKKKEGKMIVNLHARTNI